MHNEKLRALYSSTDVIRVMTARATRWAKHAARMVEEEKCIVGFGVET